MDLQEVGWEGMDWFDVAQDSDRWGGGGGAVVNAVKKLFGTIKCGEFLD